MKPAGAFAEAFATLILSRWWLGRDCIRLALAEFDDDQLSNLSDVGRQVRREERQSKRQAGSKN